jgi:hypothetical protein
MLYYDIMHYTISHYLKAIVQLPVYLVQVHPLLQLALLVGQLVHQVTAPGVGVR